MNNRSPLEVNPSFKRFYEQLRDPNVPAATTPLHVSVLNGDYRRVIRLLSEKHTDPCVTDHTGYTPLHHAALLGHLNICELLIKSGANVNEAAHDGCTPLHKAAQGGNPEVVMMLLQEGANPYAMNSKGERAYTIASHRNHVQVAILLYKYA